MNSFVHKGRRAKKSGVNKQAELFLSSVAVIGSGIRDPGSGMGKNQDPGSGINIPDQQHCRYIFKRCNDQSSSCIKLLDSNDFYLFR